MTKKIPSRKACRPSPSPSVKDLLPPTKALQEQRTLAPAHSPKPATSLHVTGQRCLLSLYADDNSPFPNNLRLATHPGLDCDEKALLDALTTALREQSFRTADTVPHVHARYDARSTADTDRIAGHNSNASTPLASKAYGVRQSKCQSQQLPTHPKRDPSHSAAFPRKRKKSSVRTPTGATVDAPTTVQVATGPVSGNKSLADPGIDTDSEGDEDRTVFVEATFDTFRAGDRERIGAYYRTAMEHAGQCVLKGVMREWIKLLEPNKQAKYPYNGSGRPSSDPRNPGLYTAPPWWPPQDGWSEGRASRHKEPDHTKKPERLYLAPILLRLTNSHHSRDFTVSRLEEATKHISMSEQQRILYRNLYRVRREEQAFEEGGRGKPRRRMVPARRLISSTDADHIINAQRFSSRRSARKQPPAKKAKQKRSKGRTSTEQLALAQTSAGTTSPAAIKVEREPLAADNPSVIHAPSTHYDLTLNHEDPFDPGHSRVSDASMEISDIFGSDEQYSRHDQSFAPAMPNLFTGASSGNGDCSMGDVSLCPPVNSGLDSQTPASFADDLYRRPASVLYEPSPSYRTWPACMGQWNSIDDFGAVALPTVRLRQPRGSIGFPPNPVAMNHDHGQPAQLQALICAQHNCSNSHTHGCRTPEAQQQLCAAHGCTRDPRTYSPDTVDANTLVPQPGIWDHKFAQFQAASAMGFNANNSFPQ
ncbi:MAG: hypothetical protein Q9173_000759 [Seirophora scorigena]